MIFATNNKNKLVELKTYKTLAELTNEEKNKISARFIAAKALKQKLKFIK